MVEETFYAIYLKWNLICEIIYNLYLILIQCSFEILKVGAQTETELKEKKLRVEDALNATKVMHRIACHDGLVL